ncbi:T-cell surface glycoprotein CD5 [Centroberyx affinis]|uniref:T-cell surface glycoprotein CD5 n=1 Tax=Centroberyx affinis TaxID=166261 RepID=UPI003A5BD64F
MDLRIVAALSALLLMTVESKSNATDTPPATQNSTQSNSADKSLCPCPSTPVYPPTPKPPALGILTVKWEGKSCVGEVHLSFLASSESSESSSPHCYDTSRDIQGLLSEVCKRMKGCTDKPTWSGGNRTSKGFKVGEKDASCTTLKVHCKVVQEPVIPDVRAELNSYKVAMGLLCFVLLLLVLLRFTKPTVKALQKRLSDRRQSRWIGPTQSQSVSYHRGKALQNDEGEKRLSYPALERLTVSASREPSSNRNSDFNY